MQLQTVIENSVLVTLYVLLTLLVIGVIIDSLLIKKVRERIKKWWVKETVE
jgi:hypothetical protein